MQRISKTPAVICAVNLGKTLTKQLKHRHKYKYKTIYIYIYLYIEVYAIRIVGKNFLEIYREIERWSFVFAKRYKRYTSGEGK